MFNILSHGEFAAQGLPFAEASVLDAFAGTGALGLEALSRGAARAVFIEQDCEAIEVLRKNIVALGEGSRTRVIRGDATRPPRADAGCAVVFLDAPYRSGLAGPALAALAAGGWLVSCAVAVVEVAAGEQLTPPPGFTLIDQRAYGAAWLLFLRRADGKGDAR